MTISVPLTSATFGFLISLPAWLTMGILLSRPRRARQRMAYFLHLLEALFRPSRSTEAAAPVPGGGTFSLTPPVPVTPPGTFTIGINFLQNFAAINGESDVAFGAPITGGSADSGYFRVLQNGPAAGTLQPVVLQGQAAPGGGTFNTITVPSNIISVLTNLGPNFALGPDGAPCVRKPSHHRFGLNKWNVCRPS